MAFRTIFLCTLLSYVAVIAASPIEGSLPENEKVEIANPASQNENLPTIEESSSEDDVTIEDSDERLDSAGYGKKSSGKTFLGKVKDTAAKGMKIAGKAVTKVTTGARNYGGKFVNGVNNYARKTGKVVAEYGRKAYDTVKNNVPNKRKTQSMVTSFGRGLKDVAQTGIEAAPAIIDSIAKFQSNNVAYYDNQQNIDFQDVNRYGDDEESENEDNQNDNTECQAIALRKCLLLSDNYEIVIECQKKAKC